MVVDLLADGAAVGRAGVAQAKPPLTIRLLDFTAPHEPAKKYDGSR